MNRKFIITLTLIMTICFLLLGTIFKITANKHKGLSASSGVIINGEYSEVSSGKIGANKEKYEAFNTSGIIFYVLSGITGIVCIATTIQDKKSS